MTRLLAGVALVGTILLVLSCTQAPTAPSISAVSQSAGTQLSTASQTWTRLSAAVDSVLYCECLGENVHFLGERAFEYHFVATGSGSYQILWHAVPVTPTTSAPLSAHGETSGRVFVNFGSPMTETFNLGSRIQVQTMVDRQTYAAIDGSKLVLTSRIHVTAEGDGHVIVQKVEPWSVKCLK